MNSKLYQLAAEKSDIKGAVGVENASDSDHVEFAEDVSYGHSGLRGIIESPYVFGAAFLAAMGGFSFGYDQGVISLILVMPQFAARYPEISSTHARSGFYNGFMTGMLELGAFLGCLFYPYLADKISRKRALSCAVIVFDIGAIIQTVAPDYGCLVAGRFIGGIGVGTLAMGAPLYISEIAPPNIRGSLLVLEQVAIVIGAIIAYWITYGTRQMAGEAAFRVPFGLQMVVATILGVGIHFFPYTPRWLALVGRDEDSLKSLCKLRNLPASDSRVQAEWRGIRAEVAFQQAIQGQAHPGKTGVALEVLGWRDLFTRKLYKRSIIAIGLQFFQQFSGINAFVYYAPKLFTLLGQGYEQSLILSGMINICQLVANVPTLLFLDNVGRRNLALYGAAVMCAAHVIMAALTAEYHATWASHPSAAWASVALVYIYTLAFACSFGPVAWVVPAEVFPNWCRSKGVGLSVATNWITNFIIGLTVPVMIENIGYGTFVFFAIFCGLAVIWTWFFLPEVGGKTLEQMDEVFKDHSSAEEANLKYQIALQINQEDHRHGSIARRLSTGEKDM